jgi:DNA-directed RNA polymerase specialized sigma24 family protein
VNYWRKESGGVWPRYPKSQQNISDVPGATERVCDEVLFRALRALDRFTALVYCYAPFSWLDRYRSYKNRRLVNASIKIDTVPRKLETAAVPKEAGQHVGS